MTTFLHGKINVNILKLGQNSAKVWRQKGEILGIESGFLP